MNAPQTHGDAATDFARRHIGPSPRDVAAMLETVGAKSLDALMDETLPASIRQQAPLDLGPRCRARPRRWRICASWRRRTRSSPR